MWHTKTNQTIALGLKACMRLIGDTLPSEVELVENLS